MNKHHAYHRTDPTGTIAPVVFDSPHSGTVYPEDFRPAVSMPALRHAEDAFVDELYACGPLHGATLIAARFPRSYIDPNRSLLDVDTSLIDAPWPGPAATTRKSVLGVGLIWRVLDTGEPIYSRKLTVDEVRGRIADFHQPYQKAVKDALDETFAHFGSVWHVNCHSMPAVSSAISEEGPGKPRADFVLGDRDGTTCHPDFTAFVAGLLSDMGYEVKVNDPYKGVELVRAFSDPAVGRHSLQIEVNRRLYMDERTREKTSGYARLARDIERMVKAICGFAAERGSHLCDGGHDHARGHCDHDDHGDHHDHDHGHHHEHDRSHGPSAPKAQPPAAMSRIAIELTAPVIDSHRRSSTGVDFVHTFESRRPGPHVMVNAITHGNEICGALVVDRLLRMGVRPAKGTLTLSFANIEAFLRFDPRSPYATRFIDEDFNRVWNASTLDGPRDSTELRRARTLRPFVDAADFLLDIHSMLEPSPPVMICGPLDKGVRFAFDINIPRDIVSDEGHANGTRMRDFGGFGDPASPKNALLVECGQHWERAAEDVAWQTTWRFLRQTGIVDPEISAREIGTRTPAPQRLVRVTEAVVARTPEFRFARDFSGMEVLPREGDLIAYDGAETIRAPYDNCVLVMPVPKNVKTGLTAVRLGRIEPRRDA